MRQFLPGLNGQELLTISQLDDTEFYGLDQDWFYERLTRHAGQWQEAAAKASRPNAPVNILVSAQIFKNKGRYYFTHEDYLQNRRNRNIMNIPEERRKIRPNVEALMKEFKARVPGVKAKVRGLFKTSLFAFNAVIAINFERIFRYIVENELVYVFFRQLPLVFAKSCGISIIYFQKPGFLQAIFGISCITRNIFQKSRLYGL